MTVQEYNRAVDAYADGLFRFAFKHLRNESAAQDIVQEVFAAVWERHRNIQFEKSKSYLFTAAYHEIVDWLKKEKRGYGEFTEVQAQSSEMQNFDVKSILDKALDQLPDIQKTVVLLRDYEGYAYQEIGEICQLTEAQVKVYIFRARTALKGMLKEISLIV